MAVCWIGIGFMQFAVSVHQNECRWITRKGEVVTGLNFYQIGKDWNLFSTVQSERGEWHTFILSTVDKLTTVQ